MTGKDHRQHPRLQHRAKIRANIEGFSNDFVLEMHDFSEGGLFLLWPDMPNLEIGTLMQVQTTEFENAPIQTAKIVRVQTGVGVAAEFIKPD
ncbi:PilZ domain-containing protein [Methylomonas sp. MgM2]